MALLILLAYGFDDRLASIWLPITAVPYYLQYATDLRHAGYRRRDVLKVYALNILLIPVSLGGVYASLKQACTGRRSAFARTPKVVGRTAAPAGYVVAEILLCVSWFIAAAIDVHDGRRLNAAFGLGNATIMLYGLFTFIGMRAACADMAPLAHTLRHQWPAVRAAWVPTVRRLVSSALVGLITLLGPAAATGFEATVTVDQMAVRGGADDDRRSRRPGVKSNPWTARTIVEPYWYHVCDGVLASAPPTGKNSSEEESMVAPLS